MCGPSRSSSWPAGTGRPSGAWAAGRRGPALRSRQAALVEYTERQVLPIDWLTMCRNIGLSMGILEFEFSADLPTAAAGRKVAAHFLGAALRGIIETKRNLNIQFGVPPEADTLPGRFTEEPSKGQVVPVADMVAEYCRVKARDEMGRPKG
ncbi:MAG: aldehyde ferredoxin oxidoreductase C-terminal domain-containing protein [Desulfococcaceae bacterium]